MPSRTSANAVARLLALGAAATLRAPAVRAQTIDDGFLFPKHQLRAGAEYGRDQWSQYWEGGLQRANDNIGTVTTRSLVGTAGYGATDRLSVFATLPYVWTRASEGVLHGLSGRQDLTLAAKYRVAGAMLAGRARLGAFATAGVGVPTSNYTVDFMPMSIGSGSRRAFGRAVLHLQDRAGWYVEGAAGHTWRSNVRLDRPAYYTDGHLYSTDEVEMPDVADYTAAAGYQRGRVCVPLALVTQRTLGGGDIRRQDMPFVSNRMNFTQLRAHAMYDLRVPSSVILDLGVMHTLSGRNVGRSTALTGGFAYAFGRPGF
ncbi:hypothetical protein tb265_24100 [Gemmatimonadetes bacterium T265]|nr:hypothetical protein tb265_24100 [Gemmatimonadetes bacterium T265]